jgi:hypothetical protein
LATQALGNYIHEMKPDALLAPTAARPPDFSTFDVADFAEYLTIAPTGDNGGLGLT